jgi:hypothetical protein
MAKNIFQLLMSAKRHRINKEATSLKWEGDHNKMLTFKIGDQKVEF